VSSACLLLSFRWSPSVRTCQVLRTHNSRTARRARRRTARRRLRHRVMWCLTLIRAYPDSLRQASISGDCSGYPFGKWTPSEKNLIQVNSARQNAPGTVERVSRSSVNFRVDGREQRSFACQAKYGPLLLAQPRRLPTTINTDEPVKRNGQSLNAINEFLNPVNNETRDKMFRTPNDIQ